MNHFKFNNAVFYKLLLILLVWMIERMLRHHERNATGTWNIDQSQQDSFLSVNRTSSQTITEQGQTNLRPVKLKKSSPSSQTLEVGMLTIHTCFIIFII
jgi:hypothetical protein